MARTALFISLGILALICFWETALVASLACSSPPAISEGKEVQNSDGSATDRNIRTREPWWRDAELRNAQFAKILAIVAIIQAGLFLWQLWLMRTTLSQTKVSEQRRERAYVSLDLNFTEQDTFPHPDTEFIFPIDCRNHGETPAIGVGHMAYIWRIKHSAAETIGLPRLNEIAGRALVRECVNLFPNETTKEKNIQIKSPTGCSFTASEIDSVKDGSYMFVLAVKIGYRDSFTDWHETEEWWALRYPTREFRIFSLISGRSRIT